MPVPDEKAFGRTKAKMSDLQGVSGRAGSIFWPRAGQKLREKMAACQKIGGGRHEKGGIPEESDGGKGQDFVDKPRPALYD